MVPGMNFIVESRKKFDNGNPAITAAPGSRFPPWTAIPEVSYFQRVESASLMEDGMAIPATKRRYNVTLDAALAARLDAVAALRHKHRSTIIHWAVEDWLRRYEPGIQAGLAGGSQAAMAAKAPVSRDWRARSRARSAPDRPGGRHRRPALIT